jgi:Tfp pilus assembly protein PilF
LGAAYAKLGNNALAEAEYRQALKMNPNYKEAGVNLNHLLQILGRPTESFGKKDKVDKNQKPNTAKPAKF